MRQLPDFLAKREIATLRPLDADYRGDFRYPPTSYIQDVTAYFNGKTEAILKRYGPGPRVHYHTGLLDEPPSPSESAQVLRRRLVTAQERLLSHAAKAWNASSNLTGEVLDVGCGLGGGAIYWAQEFGAHVTAVTCVPSHVNWVERLAVAAGVESRVRPLLCDAEEVPGENSFDAAVAVDSSGYLCREKWFRRIAALLRRGGRVFIVDCFLERPDNSDEEIFNLHWHTRIGTIDEYLTAARNAGLTLQSIENISHRTVHFWTTTLALIHAEAKENGSNPAEVTRQQASLCAHALVQKGLADGSFSYAMISFAKRL
jgi:cyclopropane fatty-acyl-phospholipid synthase-like methyltransferase